MSTTKNVAAAGDDDSITNNANKGNNDRIIRHQRKERARIQDVSEMYAAELNFGPVDPERRERCKHDLALFCTTYFAPSFTKEFSDSHIRAFELIQKAIETREKFAFAMPRGSGKSTICLAAIIWGALYGKSVYSVLVNATSEMATDRIEAIKTHLLTNELLFEDFPEVCCAIRHMEGEIRRCNGQHYLNEPTNIKWEKSRIVLPTMDLPYAEGSGCIIESAGIGGNMRGKNRVNKKGETKRPDLILVDDPQTDESADSVTMTRKRIRVVKKTIAFLGGTSRKAGIVMPCTVIKKDDLAEHFLDNKKNPEWHGERTKMLDSFPTNLELWHKYYEIYQECYINREPITAATDFYKRNYAAMTEGAKVSWDEGYDDSKASDAIEYCMQLFLSDPESFFAEFQNDPQDEDETKAFALKADDLVAKMSGVNRGIVPHDTTLLVAQIDVQKTILYYTVMAFRPGFSGEIVEYGAWPEQGIRYFTLSSLKKTLKQKYRNHGDEAALLAGLQDLYAYLATKEWPGESGQSHRIGMIGCDENYQTDIVHKAIRTSPHAGLIVPYRGRGITASMMPLCSPHLPKKDGEDRRHFAKFLPNKGGIKTLHADVNFWKSFCAARLTTPRGDSGSICLPQEHKGFNDMLVEQLTSEKSVEIRNETYGRVVHQWDLVQVGRDNHLWDCVVGCCVLAMTRGIVLTGIPILRKKSGRKVKRRIH